MVNDSIADFLTRIRNAITRKKQELTLPSTKMLEAMARILKEEGFIEDYEVEKEKIQDTITIKLKYINGVPAIRKLERVSKPGVRSYMGYRDIPRVKQGLGISIFSTPSGVMTGETARENHVGGEYLCRIW